MRGLAIALVMALHFVNNQVIPSNAFERAAVKLTNYGLWGVDLFFVLSGFLITGILVDSKGRSGYFTNFFAKRALRIFPLYYGVLLLLMVVVPAALLQRIDPQLLDLRHLWAWLWLYLTNFYLGPETTFSIPYVSHFWSLAVEEHFYLVWPFLMWWLSTRAAMRLCLVLAATALALRIWFSIEAPSQLYAGVLTPCRIDALCIGAWFALAARDRSPLPSPGAVRLAWLAGAAVVMLSLWQLTLHRAEALVLPLRTSGLAVFFGAIIYGARYHDGMTLLRATLRLGWLRHLGRYSYGLYVFHGIVAYGMHRYDMPRTFSTLTDTHMLNSALMVSFGVSVSYAIAMLSYHGFEQPFLSLKKRFETPRTTTRAATGGWRETLPEMNLPHGDARASTRPTSVSILINNFNYGQFVGQAIESALAQTRAVEVIVVDDGSTDDSRQVIAKFGSRIRMVFQDNGGQGAAMNAGFAVSTGDIVIFLDADDLLDPRVAATLLESWLPQTVMAQYPLHIVDTSGRKLGIYPDPPSSLANGDVRHELLQTGAFGANVTSGLAFLRTALNDVMPLPADELKNAADGYLVRAIAFLGQVQRIDATLGFYRRHDSNDSNVCATPGGLADGFRKKIGYARKEMEVTRLFAARHGLEVDEAIGESNAEYVGYRLFLLLTDPTSDLVGDQRRWSLLRKYVAARFTSEWPLQRKALAIALATAATISPMPTATRILTWLHDPQSRPEWWRVVAGRLRRA